MNKPYMNERGWSDTEPYEVVNVISETTVEIRAMKAEPDTSWSPDFVPGGFSGVVTNQEQQKWIITSDPEAPIFRVRKHKNGKWKSPGGTEYRPSDAPRKYYDYNF
jgi:hypothetical protein